MKTTNNDSAGIPLFLQIVSPFVVPAPSLNFFKDTVHLSFVSPTGAGKTVALKLLLAKMANNPNYADAEVIVLDPKNFEFLNFSNLSNVFLGERVLEGFEILYNRFENRLSGEESTSNLLFLIIEEFSGLLLHYDKKMQEEIKNKVARLLMMSRALNIRCILIMQRFDSAYFSNGARDNITTRISFGNISKESQRMLFPDNEVESQPKRQGYLFMDGRGLFKIIVPTINNFEKLENDLARFLEKNT